GQTADLKSIAAAGGYGMSVITALLSQNTHGVQAIEEIDHDFVRKQFDSVFGDVTVDAIKIGMLGDAATVALVREALRENPAPVVVLDPVMVSSSGHRLLEEDAEDAVRGLVADVDVITPNVPELAVLTGKDAATDYDAAVAQAQPLARENDTIVIVKGGHPAGSGRITPSCTRTGVWIGCRPTASIRGIPTAPAAASPRRWPPAWGSARTPGPRCAGRPAGCTRRSRTVRSCRSATAPASARSTTATAPVGWSRPRAARSGRTCAASCRKGRAMPPPRPRTSNRQDRTPAACGS